MKHYALVSECGRQLATEYYADDFTMCGERLLYSEVVVHIEAKKVA